MKVVRGFKNGERGKDSRRKFVVPETGDEMLDFEELSRLWKTKVEYWPCTYVQGNEINQLGFAAAIRLRADAEDARLLDYIREQIERLELKPRSEVSKSYRLKYDRAHSRNQWGVLARLFG